MKLRLKQAGRWIGYIVIGAGIIVITIALVAYGQGYFYSQETGEITGGGVLYIGSTPSNADIFVSGEYRGKTEERVRLPSGEYTVELHRKGHRSWSKNATIRNTKVTHVHHPLLIPNAVSTTPVKKLQNVRFVSQSDNQQYLAVVEADNGRDRVRVFPANSMNSPSVVFIESRQQPDLTITDFTWSPDNSRALITATSGENVQYYIFNPNQENNATSVTNTVNMPLRDIKFGNSSSVLYGVANDGVLRRFDIEDSTSSSVARNVHSFTIHEGTIYMIRSQSNGSRLVRFDGNSFDTIAEYSSSSLQVSTVEFDDNTRLLLHNTERSQTFLVNGVGSDPIKTTSFPVGAATEVTTSPGGRFIVMYTDAYFTTYDIERDELHRFTIEGLNSVPHWYTSHHLLAVGKAGVILFEFDGANQEYLTNSESYAVFGNRDQDAIYSIKRNQLTEQLQLQQTDLE